MRKIFILLTASIVCYACGSKPVEETIVDEGPANLLHEHVPIGSLYYNLYDDFTAEVTFDQPLASEYNYSWLQGELEIPYTVGYDDYTYAVTRIGDYAFRGCDNITTVGIPDCVESIGMEAFAFCENLSYVSFPNSITSVDYRPFYDSEKLTYPIYNDYVFAYIPTYYSGVYVIPNGIETIGAGVFSDCTELTSIIIPNSVTTIGNAAFHLCKNLRSINLPNSVTNVGDKICWGCMSLNMPIYNEHVFAFLPYDWEGQYVIPEGIEEIANSAFWCCNNLTSVIIPNTVTRIGDRAFVDCKNLVGIDIPSSVSVVGDAAFLSCERLSYVTYTNPEMEFGEDVFLGCPDVIVNFIEAY